jgi:hypothetical protein
VHLRTQEVVRRTSCANDYVTANGYTKLDHAQLSLAAASFGLTIVKGERPNMTDQPASARSRGRVARAFGLEGEAWMRHTNPVSVWTRYAVLPLLALSVWSRAWIGWWCLVPVALSLVWMVLNPRFFREPRSTKNWVSKSVLGERLFTGSDPSTFPAEFRSRVPQVTTTLQAVGLAILVYGLVVFDAVAAVTGVLLTQVAKLWYLDRMVLLFEAVKVERRRSRGVGVRPVRSLRTCPRLGPAASVRSHRIRRGSLATTAPFRHLRG